MAVLASQLKDLGLEAARIGIEMDYLPAGDFARLARELPKAQFSGNEAILARLRQIKTADEIVLLRRLSRIADQSITDALAAVKTGDTEMDIAAHMTRNIYTLGAEHFKLMIVATGERSQLPNVGPSERKLQLEDVCRVEIFSVIAGYQAGVCRTAVVQRAPAHAEKIWQNLVECCCLITPTLTVCWLCDSNAGCGSGRGGRRGGGGGRADAGGPRGAALEPFGDHARSVPASWRC